MTQTSKAPKFVTNEVRLTFVHINAPNPKLSGPTGSKYTLCALVPKSDAEGVKKLRDYIDLLIDFHKATWGGRIPDDLNNPLKDGDIERTKYSEYANHYYFNCGTKFKPTVYNHERIQILDPTQIYSGMYARLCVAGFAYSHSGKHGVSLGLESVQKTRDGEHLFRRTDLGEVFVDEPDDILA